MGTDPLKLCMRLQEWGFKIKRINEGNQSLHYIESIEEFYREIRAGQGFDLLLEK